jgi:hypothetical protein
VEDKDNLCFSPNFDAFSSFTCLLQVENQRNSSIIYGFRFKLNCSKISAEWNVCRLVAVVSCHGRCSSLYTKICKCKIVCVSNLTKLTDRWLHPYVQHAFVFNICKLYASRLESIVELYLWLGIYKFSTPEIT